jgi:hypothetical protein
MINIAITSHLMDRVAIRQISLQEMCTNRNWETIGFPYLYKCRYIKLQHLSHPRTACLTTCLYNQQEDGNSLQVIPEVSLPKHIDET